MVDGAAVPRDSASPPDTGRIGNPRRTANQLSGLGSEQRTLSGVTLGEDDDLARAPLGSSARAPLGSSPIAPTG
jgi:hypothetical protein